MLVEHFGNLRDRGSAAPLIASVLIIASKRSGTKPLLSKCHRLLKAVAPKFSDRGLPSRYSARCLTIRRMPQLQQRMTPCRASAHTCTASRSLRQHLSPTAALHTCTIRPSPQVSAACGGSVGSSPPNEIVPAHTASSGCKTDVRWTQPAIVSSQSRAYHRILHLEVSQLRRRREQNFAM